MTLTIELAPEELAQLRLRAAGRGQDAARYAADLLRRDLQVEDENAQTDAEDRPMSMMDPEEKARFLAALVEPYRPTPERVAEKQARFAHLRPANPPTDGTNGMHRVFGHWPGDETDEQVAAALEKLS